ncbi:MAG TPA: RNA helicase [Campylobacterales bacterium]|nr:RNA helicase [Campylobacterales bacterium]
MNNQTWQEKLNRLLNCDLKSLFPVAREQKRKLYFFVGPTNSGKTYQAMQELMEADCGVYLAPLRLLALENYEYLTSKDIPTSLITGEEEKIDEDAGHICSTIEMVNFNYDVDVCVIDEVQMIEDVDRGWAWVNAIVGAPASKVIMTGSVNALDAIKKIAEYLEEDLEVVKFKRKNPLEVLHHAIPFAEIQSGTALIAFSRAEVLRIKSKLSKQHKVSVIYGNLSPEVRKEEARRFREGESSVLVATDAIAMGLNLPIKTLLFTADSKYDGISNRPLTPNEIIQISGRAGRYGHHDNGYIGATSKKILKHIQSEFHASLHTIKPPFQVKASTTQILSLAEHLKTQNLYKILDYFSRHMNFTGPFIAANIGYMKELAKMIDDKKELSLEEKYMLVQAPVNTRSPLIKRAYFHYINAILNGKIVKYKPSITISKTARSQKEMLQAEDEVKKISLYLWIAYKLPELFPDAKVAEAARSRVNHFCQNSLKSKKLMIEEKPRRDKNYKDKDRDRSRRRNRRRDR